MLAVQGPRPTPCSRRWGSPPACRTCLRDRRLGGATLTVCRTGYTGERGYELIPPAEAAPALWDALLEQVRAQGGLPCGLGARDTLRTEMGYPLHGHELTLDITPVQARSGWAVGWSKPAFWGRERLLAERERGADAAAPGPAGARARRPAGRHCPCWPTARSGGTTSGTFSPTLRQGIGLALLARSVNEGDEVVVDVRGRPLRCRVVKPPFVDSRPA